MGPRLEQRRIVLIVEGRAHRTVTPFVERHFPIPIGIGDSKKDSMKQERFLIHDERTEFRSLTLIRRRVWKDMNQHLFMSALRYRIVIQRTVKTSQRDFGF
jgi:hypothetical protein